MYCLSVSLVYVAENSEGTLGDESEVSCWLLPICLQCFDAVGWAAVRAVKN